jgi:hypothetical protein
MVCSEMPFISCLRFIAMSFVFAVQPSNLNTSFDAYLTLRLIVIVGRMGG